MTLAVTGLLKLGRYLLFVITTLVVIACVAVFGSRLQVNEGLRGTIEAVASENAGMAIEVGQVRGTWWSGITLHDVKVHGTPDPRSEVIASVPLIQAGYTLTSFFGHAPSPIRLDIYHPDVRIRVRKDRLMNLQPRMRVVHDDPPAQPAPNVDLVFHGGHVSYGDASTRKPFEVEVGRVTGTGRLRGFDLDLSLQAMHEADVVRADVRYDLKGLNGTLDAHAEGLDLPYWVNRFGWAPEYEMLAGEADVVAHAAWRDPFMLDELKLSGQADLRGGKVWLKNVAVPLEGVAGRIAFDQRAARLQDIQGTLAGMPIVVRGEVRDLTKPAPYLGYPDQVYEMEAIAPAVDLARLSTPWPGLKSLGLGGHGVLVAKVSGPVSDPVVDMVGTVPLGRWGKETLTDVVINGRYTVGRLDLPSFTGKVAGGRLSGSTHVGLPEGETSPVPYEVAIAFDGLRLPTLLDHYLEEPLMFAVDGAVRGTYTLAGVGAKSVAQAKVRAVGARIDGRPVEESSLTWRAEGGKWRIPDWTLRWGRTRADVAVDGTDAGQFAMRFDMPEGDLAWLYALNPEPPEAPVTGTARGRGDLRGAFAHPDTWTGKLAFELPTGTVWHEPFDRGLAEGHVAHNVLHIDKASARFLKGIVRTSGTYRPFTGKRDVEAFTRFDIRLQDLDLGAATTLPPAWRELRGRANGRLDYAGRRKYYEATGQLSAARVRHPGWGELERVRASVMMTPTEVSLMPATWTQDGEQVRASGTVTMPKGLEPSFDLRVRTTRADLATLFDAVRWEAVMERVAPQVMRPVPALGPLTTLSSLPGRGAPAAPQATSPRARVASALSEQLAHWQAYRKAPAQRSASTAAVLPFWEDAGGKVSLDAHLTGTARSPHAELELQLEGVRVLGRKLDEVEARLVATPERVRVGMARVREGGRTVLTAGGSIADGPHDALVVRAHGLDLGWLDRALAPKQIALAGRAEGLVRLRGPFEAPRIEAEGALLQGRFGAPGLAPLTFDEIRADLAFERGRLWIDKATVTQEGRQATIAGSLPVDERARGPAARLDLAIRLEDANLGIVNLLTQTRFRWLGGKGVAALQLGGTMAKPSLVGRLDLHEGRFEAKGLDGPVEDFEADVAIDDAKIDIRTLKGRYGGGGFELLGEVFLDQFQPSRLNLTALARPFRMRTPDGTYNGMLEANMKLTGAATAPTLSGQVALWDGIVSIRDQIARDPDAAPPQPLKLAGLNVVLGPSLYVRNALMDVSVTTLQRQGHLQIDGTLAAPRPRGVVIVESGTIRPLNNPFKITEGRVEFLGENVGGEDILADILGADGGGRGGTGLNGRLDVRARTAVYDYTENETVDVTAHVTGTLDRMEMRFTALPIRSEQEVLDILSKKQVLAGTFSGKLDGGEVIVKEVGGFVTSNLEELVSPYTLRLRNILNLQTFRFELVSNYEKTSLVDLAGFRPALTLETRPLFERLSLGSRLVAGELYDTSPNTGNDSTYASMNFRLNRRLSVEYRVDPYVDPWNQRLLNQTLGLRAQVAF